MARETLRDFLNTIGQSGKDKIDFTLTDETGDFQSYISDLSVDPNTGEPLLDLASATSGLLGDYAAYIQKDADVFFDLEGGNVQAVSAIKGNVLPAADTQGAVKVFVPSMGVGDPSQTAEAGAFPNLQYSMTSWSNSGKFDSDVSSPETLSDFLDKTKGTDGHYLLAGIVGDNINETGKVLASTDATLVREPVPKSTEIMSDENRYYPVDTAGDGKAFSSDTEARVSMSTIDESVAANMQRGFGEYNPDEGSDSTASYIFDNLRNVATSMMIKSAGYTGIGDDIPDETPEGDLTEASPAIRIERDKYSAQDAYGSPMIGDEDGTAATAQSIRTGRGYMAGLDSEETDSMSYGHINTPDTPYSNLSSAATLARAAAAIVAVKSAISTFEEIIVALASGEDGKVDLGRGPLFLGCSSLYKDPKLRLLRNSLFVSTDRDYGDCVAFGAEILFGTGYSSDNADDIADASKSVLGSSPGYFLAVARSILRGIDQLNKSFGIASGETMTESDVEQMVDDISRSKIVGYLNVLATIGNIGHIRSGGDSDVAKAVNNVGPFDVDKLPDGPSTRVGKSRTSDGFTVQALSMRTSATPAIYMVPKNIIRAAYKMGTLGIGTNPLRGMMASSLGTKTYLDESMEDENARIPNDIVERLENALDAEYVPFYFHDLRTNEIVSFHAFLESLSDDFSPKFTSTKGYGRIDAVQTYNTTDRSLGLSFYVAATSQEDFDEMWFKINKLTTLVYPQWTRGTQITSTSGDNTFVQPFSQVMGATPLIRLRVGDVIKSNYSKFHLGRLFGIGNQDTTIVDPEVTPFAAAIAGAQDAVAEVMQKVFYAVYGSPLAYMTADLIGDADLRRGLRSVGAQFLTNGFANPLLLIFLRLLRDPDVSFGAPVMGMNLASVGEAASSTMFGLFGKDSDGYGYHKLCIVWLKPTMGRSYYSNGKKEQYRFSRPVKCMVMDKTTVAVQDLDAANSSPSMQGNSSYIVRGRERKTIYTVTVIDSAVPAFGDNAMFFKQFQVTHSDLIADPNFIFNLYVAPVIDPIGALKTGVQGLANELALAAGVPTDVIQILPTDSAKFMNPNNNAIVRAFSTTRGRGLAGVLTSLKFNWYDGINTWETDWNSRAPKVVKVSLGFDVIHDIPPGLGHDGFNRAPIYNVGRVMNTVAGDVYDDNGAASEYSFRNDSRKSFRKVNKD